MGRTHVVTERIEVPAIIDEETGAILSPATVRFETTTKPFTPDEEAACDAQEAAIAENVARQQAAKESLDRMLAASGLTPEDLKKLLIG